jgi:L-alanine-DL-glutamate epimerase-like enolase superfamily enzyme
MNIWIEKIHLDLKVNWKLSRNQTTFKENFIIHLDTSEGHFRSEIAPNIRYGETLDNIKEEFDSWPYKNHLQEILTQSDLSKSLSSIKLHSLRFGLESVLLSYFASRLNLTLTDYLHLPPVASVATSFSMPIMPVNEIADYLRPLSRFDSLKIKVDAASGKEMLLEIKKHTNAKLRVDANEAWSDLDDFLKFENSLKGMNIELIEQPFPSKMIEEYKELKKRTQYKLLADESIEDIGDFNELSAQFHAVNIKLMKTGSLLKAKEFLMEAKKHNLEAMMGCMIETTIGISYGMLFSGMVEYVDLDGFLLIKDEPFRLVKEAEGKLNIG